MKKIFLPLIILALFSCGNKELCGNSTGEGLRKLDFNKVPVPPLIIIGKYVSQQSSTAFKIVYVDSTGQKFYFETEFYNEDKYQIGHKLQ